MDQSTLIHDVSDTSFWVAHYRAVESERADALFHDPFAQRLVGDRGKSISESMAKISRYTAWSVVSRTVIIDRFIEKLIDEGVDAVVNLGAGLDTRPYRMNLPSQLEWVEVDYPKIIQYKTKILGTETSKCRLSRFEVDLADERQRREFLNSVAPKAEKVLVLTEGVIPYLSPEQVRELSADLMAQPRFCFWITEYFDRRVYRHLKSTVRTIKMRNAPFRFYPEDWFGFFKELGWVPKEIRYTSEIAQEFKRMPPMPAIARVLFVFMPKKVKEQAMRMAGYMIFERAKS